MTLPATLSAKDIQTEPFVINIGPQHPSTHGVLYLEVKLDGEIVIDCACHIGYLHRSFEKLAENRTYTQFIPFTDRLDYLASMNNNLAYVMAAEKLLKVQVPERAQYLRVLMAELNRIASHLLAIGTFAQDLGAFGTPLLYCFREREKILDIFDALCGNRLTYNYMRIGGVQFDLTPGIETAIRQFIPYMRSKLGEYEWLLTNNPIFLARTKNIGVLSKEMALNYSITGPNLRACGVNRDLRKDLPYLVYDKFKFDVPVGKAGDAWDRYRVRMDEIEQSLKIVEQALGGLPSGDPCVKVGKIFKPAAGDAYMRTENPRGELGFYLVGDGTTNPYRLKIRAPSFSNLAVLPELVRGLKVADIICILGSLDVVMGEIDR